MAFKDWAHWGLVGIGSVLSIIPGVGPLVGGAIMAGGLNIPLTPRATADPVSYSAANLNAAVNNAGMYGVTASGGSVLNMNSITGWIQQNLMIIGLAIAAIFVLPKLLKK